MTVERVNYRGWVDSFRLTAGRYSLVVVPEIGGRIMEYSVAGKNVIWENSEEFGRTYPIAGEWHNYGGYKNWIGQKNRWQWPPDPVLDYGKANVEVIQSPNEPPVLIDRAPGRRRGSAGTRLDPAPRRSLAAQDGGQ